MDQLYIQYSDYNAVTTFIMFNLAFHYHFSLQLLPQALHNVHQLGHQATSLSVHLLLESLHVSGEQGSGVWPVVGTHAVCGYGCCVYDCMHACMCCTFACVCVCGHAHVYMVL